MDPCASLVSKLAAAALIFGSCLSLSVPAHADKHVALVIGNSAYRSVPRLDNPKNDAALMAETLRSLGFTLVGGGAQLDLDKSGIDRAVQNFGDLLLGADVGLFYYAGHGIQVRDKNYLVPVDANPTREADLDFQMLDSDLVLRQMADAGTKLNFVILDACRNNPFGGRGLRATRGGLAQMQAPEGTLISFATQPGNVAKDGADGNSPFTKALAQTIKRPGLGIFDVFNEVGLAVMQATGNTQLPWYSTSPIKGHFYFAGAPASGPPPAAEEPREADTGPVKEARLTNPAETLRPDLMTDCDRLAASPGDPQRPPTVAGVSLDKIDIVPALTACNADNAPIPRCHPLRLPGRAYRSHAEGLRARPPALREGRSRKRTRRNDQSRRPLPERLGRCAGLRAGAPMVREERCRGRARRDDQSRRSLWKRVGCPQGPRTGAPMVREGCRRRRVRRDE